MFILLMSGVFAQEQTVVDPETPEVDPITAVERTEIDPIIAVERTLSLADDGAGAALAPPPASALTVLRVLLTLAVVAAAIYGLIFLIKRASRGNAAQDPFLKVLASAPLGANRGAHIISVGSQAWLVGAAESGVTLISEIGDKEILDAMLLEDSRRTAEAGPSGGGSGGGRFPDFKALLRRLGMPVDAAPPGPENIRKRGERLKGI
jgi:flagellar protein FliO/FliZ